MAKAKKTAAKRTKKVAAAKVAVTAVKHAKPSRKAVSGSKASDVVDQQLARYRSMRDFSITSEPGGGSQHAVRVSQQALQGSHPAPPAFLRRLRDTNLESANVALDCAPIDGVPFLRFI